MYIGNKKTGFLVDVFDDELVSRSFDVPHLLMGLLRNPIFCAIAEVPLLLTLDLHFAAATKCGV